MAIDAHMRRRASAKATDWRRQEARLNTIRMHRRQLFEQVSLNSGQIVPTFDPIDTDPAAAARIVRMQWRMPSGPVRNLLGWLEAAGCVVVKEAFPTRRVDGLSQWIGDHPVVLLNEDVPRDRLRWTGAHELGHICLHSTYVTDEVERQANAFAAEFLMPEAVIKSQLRGLSVGRLHDLKRQWGVSMQALVERAHGLGLLGARARTNLYKSLSAKGWRTKEPLSDEIAPEEPRLTSLVADSLAAKGLTPADVAELAGFSTDDRNTIFRQSPTRRLHTV